MPWQQLVDRVMSLRPDWDPAELGAFRYLEGGYSNSNYRFRYRAEEFVLRVPGKPTAYTDRALEYQFYRKAIGLPAPDVIAFDVPSGAMISRWISGRLLADLDPDPVQIADYLRGLHQQLSDVCDKAHAAMNRVYDPLEQARGYLAAASVPDWIQALAHASTWDPPELAICHNDLNPWNVLESSTGEWITLDWEWLGRNDPLFDLIALHQGMAWQDSALPALAARLLGRTPEPDRVERCLRAFWLREYAWASGETASGNQRPEIVAQCELGARRLAAFAAAT